MICAIAVYVQVAKNPIKNANNGFLNILNRNLRGLGQKHQFLFALYFFTRYMTHFSVVVTHRTVSVCYQFSSVTSERICIFDTSVALLKILLKTFCVQR